MIEKFHFYVHLCDFITTYYYVPYMKIHEVLLDLHTSDPIYSNYTKKNLQKMKISHLNKSNAAAQTVFIKVVIKSILYFQQISAGFGHTVIKKNLIYESDMFHFYFITFNYNRFDN